MPDFRTRDEEDSPSCRLRPELPFHVFQVQEQVFVQATDLRHERGSHKEEGPLQGVVRCPKSGRVLREAPAPPSDTRGPNVLRVLMPLNRSDEARSFVGQGHADHPVDRGRWHDEVCIGQDKEIGPMRVHFDCLVVRGTVAQIRSELVNLKTEAASCGQGSVGGSVVEHDDFRLFVGRGLKRPQAGIEGFPGVVVEHEHEDPRVRHARARPLPDFSLPPDEPFKGPWGMRAVRRAIIATVRNEESRLEEFLASLEGQSVRPDIVVVTDGDSTDRTPALLEAFAGRTSLPYRWSSVAGNRSVGRNTAVRIADVDVIACTDVCVLDPSWFERIVAPIERGEADVVAGWYELNVHTVRERALGLLTQYSIDQIHPDTFLPSSRSVAFTRAAWRQVGGYPEDLETAEDTVFDLRLRGAGLRFRFEPSAVVRWRPATSVRAAYRMYRQFAESDGQARIFLVRGSRYAFVYGVYATGFGLLLLGLLWWPLWILLIVGAAAYVTFRVRKVIRAGLWAQVPYAVGVGFALDAALLSGYLRGFMRGRRGLLVDTAVGRT
jgi:glycosyltransferase involved in cell wall biosynthesis